MWDLTALKEFLQIFQRELENADYQEGQIKQYLEPIQKFIEQPKVAAILGDAFEVNCKSLDQYLCQFSPESREDFNGKLSFKRGLAKVVILKNSVKVFRKVFFNVSFVL